MDILDLLLTPIYLAMFFLLARRTVNNNAENPIYGAYYIRGLMAKFGATIFFTLIYIYYYKGGDSLAFYYSVSPLYGLTFSQPEIYIRFLFGFQEYYPIECLRYADEHGVMYLLRGSPTLTTIRIASVVNLVSFNSYIVLCLFFAYISFTFQWLAFKLVVSVRPQLHKAMSVSFLFIPSVLFWGSGVGKDSIMLGSILLAFYCFYSAVILKQNIVRNILLLLVTTYLITLIRGFMIFTLIPCCILMAVTYYRAVFKSPIVRVLAGPLLLVLGAGLSIFFVQSLGNSVSSYSIDSLQQKAEGFKSWHSYLGETQGGSAYSLGSDVEYTPVGILKQAPMAIAITLFGPFIWQVRNPVMLLSALESLLLLFYTLRALFNKRIYALLGILISDHLVVFCLAFVFILSIAVGITSFNYGALVRYRIPILPFFGMLLSLVSYRLGAREE